MSGTLYLVATPIGNLGDFSPRAVETLKEADFIAAEDTRVSMKILNHFGIKKQMISYHQHNCVTAGPPIVQRLLGGESCALVTDAGTPAISDPGEQLVKLCAEADVPVISIPGCCALISALAVSGLATGRFVFEGFLPVPKKERRERLEALEGEERTVIFYEAPHKLKATLSDLSAAFGAERRLTLCREITKLHEQTLRTTIGGAIEYYDQNNTKGEYVLIMEGREKSDEPMMTMEQGVEAVLRLKEEGVRMKDAVRQISADTGLNKNALYDAALKA